AYVVPLLVLIPSCSTPDAPRVRETKGGKFYGGVFNANETEELRGLFPLSLTQAASHRIAAQMYEGLVRFDQRDLSVIPALADSWAVDASGTVYTFHLRSGVRFHDDTCFAGGKGRKLSAQDVRYCYTALCTYGEMNQMFWLFQDRIVGGNAHYQATATGQGSPGVSGIEAPDDHTVRITLTAPWPGFLQVLAHQGCWIWPMELVQFYKKEAIWHPIGTGAFRMKNFRRGEALVMERNPDYWGKDAHGDPLPFLDAVRYTFVPDKGKELEQFEAGHLSVIYELPVDRTDFLKTTDRFQVQTVPGMAVQFYGFNMRHAPFTDVRVRRAFSLAINRQALVDTVLGGLAVATERGVVPPGFADYPYDTVPVTVYDPDRARELLAKAGFPGGRGLSTVFLQVNNNGFGYVKVAEAVQLMLERELGVRVISSVLPAEQHFARVERGEATFWREGWIADHPDPENFLALFYGRNAPADTTEPSYLNSTRFRDARYDSLFTLALRTTERPLRMRLLAQAEKRLMEEGVVAPLYHERTVRLLQPWVRDLPVNGMEYRDLREVWFDPALRPEH
ncbi:MAG TPA: ABC transporter substrate-binding protein, partial [Flavobacteriales bacterium]|nr:ABC transporter substrate-binding protein [Flavobacteriales bacterium]